MSFLFRPKAERLARKILSPNQSYARQAEFLNAIGGLANTPAKMEALRTIALSKTEIAKRAVDVLPADADAALLCEVAEKGLSSAAIAAIDKLKRIPPTEATIESLCHIIRRFIGSNLSPFHSTSVPGKAVDAIRWLDSDMKHPKFVAAILDVLCEAQWSPDYEMSANWVFRSLIWMKDKITLDTIVIAELRRRAMGLPLVYDASGASFGTNRYIVFLLNLRARGGNDAGVALAEIEADLLRRRLQAIPAVLRRALTDEKYEDVEAMSAELKKLAILSVPAAEVALADFASRPARLLPRRLYKEVDYFADGVTVTETEWAGTEMVSTARLGQEPEN